MKKQSGLYRTPFIEQKPKCGRLLDGWTDRKGKKMSPTWGGDIIITEYFIFAKV